MQAAFAGSRGNRGIKELAGVKIALINIQIYEYKSFSPYFKCDLK